MRKFKVIYEASQVIEAENEGDAERKFADILADEFDKANHGRTSGLISWECNIDYEPTNAELDAVAPF